MTRPRRRPAVAGVITACLAVAAQLWMPVSAQASVVDPTTDGYMVTVQVHFHGNGIPGGDVTKGVSVSPSCWWAPAAGDYTDATAMLAWYDEVTGGSQTDGIIAQYGPRQVWQDAADAQKAGQKLSWYKAYCKDPADYTKFGIGGTDVGEPVGGGAVTYVTFVYRTFPTGVAPPAPRVSPAELARVAYAEMHIPDPVADRNPKVAGTPGAPTLVGLPTWFWVTNPLALGDAKNQLHVTAEVNQPDGRVYATVTATTGGLTVSSHYGSKDCKPAATARVSYPAGPGAKPCTVEFTHAATSLAVTTSTTWDANWVGREPGAAPVRGGEPGLTQQVTQQIAVAEVQNVVTR